ncbi:MAG TPA: hypothetical protein VE090_03720 [Methylomirabilota bacterium]|nr:hypothetical protein [Methylomirabilota bacterium]
MLFAGLFLLELLLLFLVSRQVTRYLSFLFYRLTRNQTISIYSLALLFFPGTILHELSHLLMAGILFVPVGTMELFPKVEGDYVKLGSVQIAQTDIFRRFLIGAAPFLFGTSLLLGLLFFAAQNNLFSNYLYSALLAYAVFEIGNTMFSSRKDMEGAIELLGVVAFFGLVFYFVGFRLPALNLESFFGSPIVMQVFQKGSLFLLIPLGIDIILVGFLRLLNKR